MAGTGSKQMTRRLVDAAMTVLLLFLMAYQVTGEAAHEWLGMGMTLLVIIHQILNRKWYAALFRGRYNPYRAVTALVNILLLLSFALTAFSGMSMSSHAVPFLYGLAPASFARRAHLSMSHWAFVLMGLHLGLHLPVMAAGLHLGLHLPVMAAGLHLKNRARKLLLCAVTGIGIVGLWLFMRSGIVDHLFFRVPFAFLDYDKAGWLVVSENLLMLLGWAGLGCWLSIFLRRAGTAERTKA